MAKKIQRLRTQDVKTFFTGDDVSRLREGTHKSLYEQLGARQGDASARFAVWAPNARTVSLVGEFNGWDEKASPMHDLTRSGIWEGEFPVAEGSLYKYHIVSRNDGYSVEKADPFAFRAEEPPGTASRLWALDYEWSDESWMRDRSRRNASDQPINIYEVHLGSWRRVPEEGDRLLTYREIAPLLAEYMRNMGFTHAEFLPVMEHPFYGSWGYQATGYFAPSSRYGSPQDFMFLIDYLHQAGFGVILDWVPSHFARNEHGLTYFDGTHLYEYDDPRKGEQPEWGSNVFDYGKPEVRSFLLSNAMFWLDRYHADGLRVDAVASMLYLDYGRSAGQWVPNVHGGRENLEAIDFIRQFNKTVHESCPGVLTIAEESTNWPGVTKAVEEGGLGFSMKWDMGWMHDSLDYLSRSAAERKERHNQLTFRSVYAFNEKYVLSLSHDEVVYGKGSLWARAPGDDWQKAANLRLLFAYMYTLPGKKLLFMGDEFGQSNEWYHERSLDWHEVNNDLHRGVQRWVEEIAWTYRKKRALHETDLEARGFAWINADDVENSVFSYLRRDSSGGLMLVVLNFSAEQRENYRVGVPKSGYWREILNSDAREYGGGGRGNMGGTEADPIPFNGRMQSLNLVLPPLTALIFEAS